MFPYPQNPCAWCLDVGLTLQVFERSLEKQKLLEDIKMLSLQELFVERLDRDNNDFSDHYNREDCVGSK